MSQLSAVQSTQNYEQFKFLQDNRERIKDSHVRSLVKSITARNMLEFRPIIVNQDMEIIDGQHRLKAAQQLNVPIFYQIQTKFHETDIIAYNCALNWNMYDYMNFWTKRHKPDYLKLQDFMKQNGLSLGVVLNIFVGTTKEARNDFKNGLFKYEEQTILGEVDMCWETIGYIRKICGDNTYLSSGRFWKALLRLFRHTEFDSEKWHQNYKIKVDHFRPCANFKDFCNMVLSIYNFNLRKKITFEIVEDISEVA